MTPEEIKQALEEMPDAEFLILVTEIVEKKAKEIEYINLNTTPSDLSPEAQILFLNKVLAW